MLLCDNCKNLKTEKTMKISIFLIMLFFSTLNAISLDEEISLMKEAPTGKRYELMNNIKKRIASMNGKSRAKAVSKFLKGMSPMTATNMNQKNMHINSTMHNSMMKQGVMNKKNAITTYKMSPKSK